MRCLSIFKNPRKGLEIDLHIDSQSMRSESEKQIIKKKRRNTKWKCVMKGH